MSARDAPRAAAKAPPDLARGASKAPHPDEAIGSWTLEAPLVSFGVLTTYRAKHRTLARAAHVTTTALGSPQPPATRARLVSAARLLSRAGRGVAVELLELVEIGEPGGPVAVVTDAPEGSSLREVIARESGLRAVERVALMHDVCRRVARLHASGIVHDALAPEHVHFTPEDGARLSHLWSAAPRDVGEGEDVGRVVPETGPEDRYKCPEHERVAPAPQSDVFALGVMTAELLGGEHPFGATDHAGLVRAVKRGEPRVEVGSGDATFDKAVQAALGRALARVPSLRFEHAGKLADDLAFALGGEAAARDGLRRASARLRGRSVPAEERPEPPAWRALARPLAALGGGILVVSLLGRLMADAAPRSVTPPARGAQDGQVRVLAHPWADVYVDGALVDTTPIGRPLTLSPGRHELLFKHPHAPQELRVIEVASGASLTVEVEMALPAPAPAPVDSSP